MTDYEKELASALEQACVDLNEAHNEILSLQGIEPTAFNVYDWPEWSSPANTIRWAERLLVKRLAKTKSWTEYPKMVKQVSIPNYTGDDWNHPGPWWRTLSNEDAPLLACQCGVRRLMSDHTIKDDGTVHPSILCPDCGWHVMGRLEGWSPEDEQG